MLSIDARPQLDYRPIVIARSDFARFFFFVTFTASQRKPLNRFSNLEEAGKEEKERKKDALHNCR